MITKDFLKRETNENGKQFYPMSREHRHVIKLGYGKINIKIRPKRKLDKECKTERKCVQVTVESENVKGAKGMVSIFKEIFMIFHSLPIPFKINLENDFFSNFQTTKGLFKRIIRSKNIINLNDLNWCWIILENRKSAKFSISKLIFIFNNCIFKIIF